MLEGLGLSALYPLALGGSILFLGGLIYAYLRHGRGPRIEVSSLLILRALAEKASSPKRFSPPLRIIPELLLLLLFVGGASGLYFKGDSGAIAVILDNSISMKATSPTDPLHTSFFALAQNDARATIGRLSSTSRVSLYFTSPASTIIAERPLSPSEASAKIESIYAIDAPDGLRRVLAQVVREGRFERIIVITDKRLSVTFDSTLHPAIEVHSLIGDANPPQNIAFTSLSETTSPSGEQAIRASITSYGTEATEVALALSELRTDGTTREFAKKSLTLPAHETKSILFPISSESIKLLKGTLSFVGATSEQTAFKKNALLADDELYLVRGERGSSFTLYGSLSASELGLPAIHGYSISALTPDKYTTPQTTSHGNLIFHHILPPTLPRASSLFIMPPVGSTLFSVREGNSGGFTRSLTAHPLLRYLSLTSLTLKSFSTFQVPSWMEVLVSTTAGPVALFGEKDGFRYVAVGFDLLPYEGKSSPTLSIFLLNILSWLSESSGAQQQHLPYAPLEVASSTTSPHYLGGETLEVSPSLSVTPTHPGIIELSTDAFTPINIVDESESNFEHNEEISLTAKGITENESPSLGLTHTIALSALALLVTYLLFLSLLAHRRRKT